MDQDDRFKIDGSEKSQDPAASASESATTEPPRAGSKPKFRKLYFGSSAQKFFLIFCFVQVVLTAILLSIFSLRSTQAEELMLAFSGAGLFVYFMVMLTFGLVFSNRIFGPLYRFEKHLRQLAEDGELRPIQFRANDRGQDLADAFNALVERMKNKDR